MGTVVSTDIWDAIDCLDCGFDTSTMDRQILNKSPERPSALQIC